MARQKGVSHDAAEQFITQRRREQIGTRCICQHSSRWHIAQRGSAIRDGACTKCQCWKFMEDYA